MEENSCSMWHCNLNTFGDLNDDPKNIQVIQVTQRYSNATEILKCIEDNLSDPKDIQMYRR